MTVVVLLTLLRLGSPAQAAVHLCKGEEANRYGYAAAEDKDCRSEQQHVCRCRRELRSFKDEKGRLVDGSQAYYDPSRDLCLDSFLQFQCVEKGGEWICPQPGKCLCSTKQKRCKDEQLGAWKEYGCGQGDCEDARMLRGRDPKANCQGGKRWECVPSPKCPKTGRKVCKESDFRPWRMIGCAVRGCPKGQMSWSRDRQTYLECDPSLSFKCQPHPSCR